MNNRTGFLPFFAAATIVGVWFVASVVLPLVSLLRAPGVSLASLMSADSGKTLEVLVEHLIGLASPIEFVQRLPAATVFVLAVGILGFCLSGVPKLRSGGSNTISILLDSFFPLLAGIFWIPIAYRMWYSAIQDLGIAQPGLRGLGMAHAVSPVLFGIEVSAVLVCIALFFRRHFAARSDSP